MVQISGLVRSHKLDYARPEPGRRVERLPMLPNEFLPPCFARSGVHLASMGPAHYSRHKLGRLYSFFLSDLIQFKFQVLLAKLSDDDRSPREFGPHHALSQIRR